MAVASPTVYKTHIVEHKQHTHLSKFKVADNNGKKLLHHVQNRKAEFIPTIQFKQKQKVELKSRTNTITLEQSLQSLNGTDPPGNFVSSNTYLYLLQVCTNTQSLDVGKQIHARICISGIEQDVLLATKLVNLYAKCGCLADARLVFDEMPKRNLFSWTAMVGGYVRHGQFEKGLELYYQMKCGDTEPDAFIFTCILKACAHLEDLQRGKEIHDDIVRIGCHSDVAVRNALIDMYAKCGRIERARQVFDEMSQRDVVSWNALIAGYAQNGRSDEALRLFFQMRSAGVKPDVISWNAVIGGCAQNGHSEQALKLFRQMQAQGMKPNSVTIASVIKACVGLRDLHRGEQIHDYIIRSGFELNVYVESGLVHMYAKCGRMKDACQLFEKMSKRNVVSWNAMIGGFAQNGYGGEALKLFQQMQSTGLKPDIVSWNVIIEGCAQNGHGDEALELFHEMQQVGIRPDSVTVASTLKACAGLSILQQGKKIHAHVIRSGFESNVFVGSALLDMYAKCRYIEDASKAFESMSQRDKVSWNVMIAGYAQNGRVDEAWKLFSEMQLVNMKPDLFTWNALITGYAQNGNNNKALTLFHQMKLAGVEPDLITWNAIIGGYAQNGLDDEALKLFNKMQLVGMEPNVISWTAIITGYIHNGREDKALKIFHEMQVAGIKPDLMTITSILKACACLATLRNGKEVHGYLIRNAFELASVFVESALVDMYAKCGSVEDARQIFEKMSQKNVVSWNTMISGYAMHGQGENALALFQQMQQEGMKPNHITFTGLLSACSHSGLVFEGWQYFYSLSQDYGLIPGMEHYACMVDLLGRAGHLEEALRFINQMPLEPNACVWGALFGACRIICNIELGKLVAERLFELKPEDAGNYVLLSNLYTAAGRWDDAAQVRQMMKDKGIQKIPGCSWIEFKNRVHVFIAGDRSHPQTLEIYAKLESLEEQMRDAGYVPDANFVLHDVVQEKK